MKIGTFLLLMYLSTSTIAGPPSPKEQFRDHVRSKLKDPRSAQWQHEFLWGKPQQYGPKALCGEVNAKNEYGGYTGFRRFISIVNGNVVFEDGRQDFGSLWYRWCVNPDGPMGP